MEHFHSGPSGHQEENELEFLPEGKKGNAVSGASALQSILPFCLSWTLLAKTLNSSATSFPAILHEFLRTVLVFFSVFHF